VAAEYAGQAGAILLLFENVTSSILFTRDERTVGRVTNALPSQQKKEPQDNRRSPVILRP